MNRESMVYDGKTLVYKPTVGDDIADAVQEAIKIGVNARKYALENGVNFDGVVSFDFNGISVVVGPETTLEQAVEAYHLEETRKFEAYLNSPKDIAASAERERQLEADVLLDAEIDQENIGIEMEFSDANGWFLYVNNNKGCPIVAFAERWAKLMQAEVSKGAKLEDIARTTREAANNGGVSGTMVDTAAIVLGQTWVHGNKLYEVLNKDAQPGNEGDAANKKRDVINPVFLSLDRF
jgi:hypothetical protein